MTFAAHITPPIIHTEQPIPYFSQWESASSAADILSGKIDLRDIEVWPESGAQSQEEFIEWANHVCGMCCLKMALTATTGEVVPILELTRRSMPYGAYVRQGHHIRGLIYAPFVEFLKHEINVSARVRVELTAEDIAHELQLYRFFIASVHPSIRHPQDVPPRTGGHLVLVTAIEADGVTFHNPSGDSPATRQQVTLPLNIFGRFFAGRGIAIA